MTVPTTPPPSSAPAGQPHAERSRELIARLNRIPRWGLAPSFLLIIGLGYMFTFFDIFDINVSFVQTCTQLRHGCTPGNALGFITWPTSLNLIGYVGGTLVLSPLSDRIGRRNALLITMIITGVGSLYSALSPDYANFVISRTITGFGVGADTAIVNVYINEVAPKNSRAKFATLAFINSSIGAALGTWLGLIFTTQSASWPHGLPFALASSSFTDGWRWMYGIGALLALVAILLRIELPESARWLIQRGRVDEAERVTRQMEQRSSRREPLPPILLDDVPQAVPNQHRLPYQDIFTNNNYVRRLLLLFTTWFFAYITVYSISNGFTSILTSKGYTTSVAGTILAVGSLGFVAETVLMAFLAERLQRRFWLPISAAITIVGAILVAEAGSTIGIAFVGAVLIFAYNIWIPPTYALTVENFPTRARAAGFALVDGIAHSGAVIALFVIPHIVPHLTALAAFLLIAGFLVLGAIAVQFTQQTRNRTLEEVSP